MVCVVPGVSSYRRRLLMASCALVCVLQFAACSDEPSHRTKTPSGSSPPQTQFPMPPATAQNGDASGASYGFTLMDNRRARLSDYAGYVVVLDFYATWCPPCREETPHLVELHKRYNGDGLRIIGLNVGGDEDRDKVPGFISEFQIPYALGFPDREMASFYLSDNDKIPQAFVFDRKGNLVKRFVSYDAAMTAELERVIKAQLIP